MQQQGAEQHDFEGFHDIVGAHEVAEGVVPCATVVTQYTKVGTGVEQQEETQEGTEQCHKDFFADRVNLREVHVEEVSDGKDTDFFSKSYNFLLIGK